MMTQPPLCCPVLCCACQVVHVSLIAAWGCLVCLANGVGTTMLAQISSPVATFIILNFCKTLYQKNM